MANTLQMLEGPFPSKFLTMDEVTRHIELLTDISSHSQVLQCWDGRVLYNCKHDDGNHLISDQFFDMKVIIVNTASEFENNSTLDIIKFINTVYDVENPQLQNDTKLMTTKINNNHKSDLVEKYADLKLRLYNRFMFWPYLLEEIRNELNRDYKSNDINYNPKFIYYWENTAFITPKIINDKIELILPMTKTQMFNGLKQNQFAYCRNCIHLFRYPYDSKKSPQYPACIHDGDMEFKDAVICSRNKLEKGTLTLTFRPIANSVNSSKSQLCISEINMKIKFAFEKHFDFGRIFQSAAAEKSMYLQERYWLNIEDNMFLYTKETVSHALNGSQLVQKYKCSREVCDLIMAYGNSSQYVINLSRSWSTKKQFMLLSHSLALKSENIFDIECIQPPMYILIPARECTTVITKEWNFTFGIYCKPFKCTLNEIKLFEWDELSTRAVHDAECVTCQISQKEIECYHDSTARMLFEQDVSLEVDHVKFMYPKIRLTFKNSVENHFSFLVQFDIWNQKTRHFQPIYQNFIDTSRYDCYVMFGSSVDYSTFLCTRIK